MRTAQLRKKWTVVASKNIAMAVNVFFLLLGVLLICLGVYTLKGLEVASSRLHLHYSISGGLVVIGTFLFILALFGLCGAFLERRRLLLVYMALLAVLILCEVVVGVTAYIKSDQVSAKFDQQYEALFIADRAALEEHFHCCWNRSKPCAKVPGGIERTPAPPTPPTPPTPPPTHAPTPEPTFARRRDDEPDSATPTKALPVSQTLSDGSALPQGAAAGRTCRESLVELAQSQLRIIGVTGILFAVLQATGLACTALLYRAIGIDQWRVAHEI